MGVTENQFVHASWGIIQTGLALFFVINLSIHAIPTPNYNDNFRTATRSVVAEYPQTYLTGWIHQVSRSGNPVTDTQKFVVAAIPSALRVEERYGIPAAFLLAQAIVESDRGRSRLAMVGHNYFGVKYQGTGTPMYVDGIAYNRYRDMNDSFERQGELLAGKNSQYRSSLVYKKNVYAYARSIQRKGYCPNVNYASTIREVILDFELEQQPSTIVTK